MSQPVRDIPGYYYDKQKRKYFKIQAGSPASAAYSSQDVKRRKRGDEHAEARASAIARQQGRIRKSKVLEDPLAGGFLAREQGQNGALRAPEVFARGLIPQGFLCSSDSFVLQDPLFAIGHVPNSSSSSLQIRAVNHNHGLCVKLDADMYADRYATYTKRRVPEHGDINEITEPLANIGTPTSISINHSIGLVAITGLAESSRDGISLLPHPFEDGRPNINIGVGEARGPDVSIYSSTAAPPGTPFVFAYGTSHGILWTLGRDLDTLWDSAPTADNHIPRDVFALEFLADKPQTLLSGGRRGLLDIKDFRIPVDPLRRNVIEHPSSITHIKQLDPHRIIVAGLNSTLCQYDIRFTKTTTPILPPPGRRHAKPPFNRAPSRPILQYPDYFNPATIQTGFAVDKESGVVAVAQEWNEHHAPVQLFSLHGGHTLHSPQLAKHLPPGPNPGAAHVKCVRFARDVEHKMESLYVGHGDCIRRFAWADEDEGVGGR